MDAPTNETGYSLASTPESSANYFRRVAARADMAPAPRAQVRAEPRILPAELEGLRGQALLDALHANHSRRVGAAPVRVVEDPEATRPEPPSEVEPPKPAPKAPRSLGSVIPPWCSLETLIVGAHNRSVWDTAKEAWSLAAPVGPVVVVGPPGCGKTHLLGALVGHWRAEGKRAAYLTAEAVLYATDGAVTDLFEADAIAVDDVHLIASVDGQERLARLVGAFADEGRPLVIATSEETKPRVLAPGLLSRVIGGLKVPLYPPDSVVRRSLFEMAVRRAASDGDGVEVPDDVAAAVVARVTGSARGIVAAATGIVMHHRVTGKPVDFVMAEAVVRDVITACEVRPPKVEEIQRVVARHFRVSVADMVSARRTKAVVIPRQVAMYLAKTMTPRSLPEVGRRFGNRDHSTVLHAVRKIEGLIQKDQQFADDIATIKLLLA